MSEQRTDAEIIADLRVKYKALLRIRPMAFSERRREMQVAEEWEKIRDVAIQRHIHVGRAIEGIG